MVVQLEEVECGATDLAGQSVTVEPQEVMVTKVEKESVSVTVEAAEATAARTAMMENCIIKKDL